MFGEKHVRAGRGSYTVRISVTEEDDLFPLLSALISVHLRFNVFRTVNGYPEILSALIRADPRFVFLQPRLSRGYRFSAQ